MTLALKNRVKNSVALWGSSLLSILEMASENVVCSLDIQILLLFRISLNKNRE